MASKIDKEPNFRSGKISFLNALNYYSQNHSSEDSKRWALEWLAVNQPDIHKAIRTAKDYQFSNRGFICRMIARGYKPSEEMLYKLVEFFKSIQYAPVVSNVLDTPPEPKKNETPPNPIIWDLEDMIDAVLSEREIPEITIPVDKSVLKKARQWIEIQEIEFQETLKKYELLLKQLATVSDRIDLIEGKTTRKTIATTKPQSKNQELRNAAKLVEFVKCPQRLDEFNYTGLSPIKIVGAKKIVLYHIPGRRVLLYLANDGETLSISRTALKNFDPKRSVSKMIRKPQMFFEALNNRINPFKLFETIPTKEQPAQCRLNEDVIIIAIE